MTRCAEGCEGVEYRITSGDPAAVTQTSDHVHNLQTKEHVSVEEDGTEALPLEGVEPLGCVVVVDSLDFGQARELGKFLSMTCQNAMSAM